MSFLPGPVYGLEVPPGGMMIPASQGFPASFRITMAAIDPTTEVKEEKDKKGKITVIPRSTLRIIKPALPDAEDEEDSFDMDRLRAMYGEDSDNESDEEANGGPSDPAKSKKQKQNAAIKALLAATNGDDEDEEMADVKPAKKGKGKGKAIEVEEEEEDDDDDYSEGQSDDVDLENFVVCTLDTDKNYQQTLDITVGDGEEVFFAVTGTHTVYLTGNYIVGDEDDSDEDEEDYDMDAEYPMGDSEDESDELDDIDNPRVTEVDSDEEEAPKLVQTKKGKNKRAAEEPAESLDDLIAKADTSKLSKKQQKKLKTNEGNAVAAEETKKEEKKSVQFAKNLEQGPTGSAAKAKEAAKAAPSVKVVNGVTVDDRTIGKGRAAKNGDTVGVRYIGKLQNGQQFDANKKGKPFSFKVGKGEVIKGWDIGVVGMAIGGERRLTIPAKLAYGSRGMPGIPANSTLVFDVKLLEIK